jgi:hypothetical protein
MLHNLDTDNIDKWLISLRSKYYLPHFTLITSSNSWYMFHKPPSVRAIYGSTVLLLGLGRFFSFLILYTVGRTPWRGISPSQIRYLYTQQHKHIINTYRHPCLEWDSNPRSQRSSERPLWSEQRSICHSYIWRGVHTQIKFFHRTIEWNMSIRSQHWKHVCLLQCNLVGL